MFSNFKIIPGYDVREYVKNEFRRGDRNFVMSRSSLIEFSENPAKWICGGKFDDSTDSTEWGDVVDCLALTPDDFEKRFAVCPATYPDTKTKEPKPWTNAANFCKAWNAEVEASGKTAVKASVYESAKQAVEVMFQNEDIRQLIACSEKQVFISAVWMDEKTGVQIPVKCLADMIPNREHIRFGGWIPDLKTTQSAKPSEWTKSVNKFGYDVQSAFILDMFNAATGEERHTFAHVVQENSAPYYCLDPIPILSSEFIELGRTKYQNALAYYAHCLSTNKWPGYISNRILFGSQLIEPLPWMTTQEMETHWVEPQTFNPESKQITEAN